MRILRTVLVAPSRYDERGVLVFRVGVNQNGSLGALAGLIEDYNRRHAGETEIRYEVFDEHVREAVTPELLRRWRDEAEAAGERFTLLVCGIQTATHPRGRDVALMARPPSCSSPAACRSASARSSSSSIASWPMR